MRAKRLFSLAFVFSLFFITIGISASVTIQSDKGDPAMMYEDELWHLWPTNEGGDPKCSCWDWDGNGLISMCVGYIELGFKDWAQQCYDAHYPDFVEGDAYVDTTKPWNYSFTMDTSEIVNYGYAEDHVWSAGIGWIGGEWLSDGIWYNIKQIPSGDITDFDVDSGEFERGEEVDMTVTFVNNDSKLRTNTYYVKIVLIDENDSVTNLPHEEVTLAPGESTSVGFTWTVPVNATLGYYDAIAYVWNTEGDLYDKEIIYNAFNVTRGPCVPLIVNGPHSAKIDYLLIPDETYNILLPNGSVNEISIETFKNDMNTLIEDSIFDLSPINQTDNQAKFNFYYMEREGTVDGYDPANRRCIYTLPPQHNRCGFADTIAVIHTDNLRDCASGDVFTSDHDSRYTFAHESCHAVFGLADAYCCDSSYRQPNPYPNIWSNQTNCQDDVNAENWTANCENFCPAGTGNCGNGYWRLDVDDIMSNATQHRLNNASMKRVSWVLDCGYPLSCDDTLPPKCSEQPHFRNRCRIASGMGRQNIDAPIPLIKLYLAFENNILIKKNVLINYDYLAEGKLYHGMLPVEMISDENEILVEFGIWDPRVVVPLDSDDNGVVLSNGNVDFTVSLPSLIGTETINIYERTTDLENLLISINVSQEIEDFCKLHPTDSVCGPPPTNETNVTKVHINATVHIHPETLNLKSKGRWITVLIEFPEEYDISTINISSVNIEHFVYAESNPKYGFVKDPEIADRNANDLNEFMVKFDRSEVQKISAMASPGYITLKVYGEFANGTFEGQDTIRIIHKITQKKQPLGQTMKENKTISENKSKDKGKKKGKKKK